MEEQLRATMLPADAKHLDGALDHSVMSAQSRPRAVTTASPGTASPGVGFGPSPVADDTCRYPTTNLDAPWESTLGEKAESAHTAAAAVNVPVADPTQWIE